MEPVVAFGHEVIVGLQAWRSPPLDAFFTGITFLGDEEFILLLVPILLWAVNWRLGMYVGLLYTASGALNLGLKLVFDQPRPDIPEIEVSVETIGEGFPSGHAQSAVLVLGWLAAWSRRRWSLVLAVALVLLIGLSRVYLAVHFPHDVLGGWLIGLMLLVLVLQWAPAAERWLSQQPLVTRLGLAVTPPLLLALVVSNLDVVRAAGALLGVLVGAVFERHYVRLDPTGTLWQRAIRIVLGLIVLLALWGGLKPLLPVSRPAYFMRYALVGLWATLGAPWTFIHIGMATSTERAR